MKCANCAEEALYEYKITKKLTVLYCGTHVPNFLTDLKKSGALAINSSVKSKSAESVDTVPPVEETSTPTE